MVTAGPDLVLSPGNLLNLFPFYLLVNSSLIVDSCGRSMEKLHSTCVGEPFTSGFELVRPMEPKLDFTVFSELVSRLIIFKTINGSQPGTIFKGQVEYLQDSRQFLFTGTPWFNSIQELRLSRLNINDFPHNNPTVELLYQLKTQEVINQDLNQLVSTISEQKDTLKKGEEQILNSLQKERELSQIKSNFVSLASHEFRTPLACIRSSIELMQLNLSRPGMSLNNIVRHQNNILSEVDHLSALIDEVLTVGKIESNTFTCKKELLELDVVLSRVISNTSRIQDDGRSVTVLVEGNSNLIQADPLLLNHILTNLISNSLKYSKGCLQPVITIIYRKEDLQIKIKDFGIGIPQAQQGKIFQAFFRAENVYQVPGTGLGMFITKSFVGLHGGEISFTSDAKNGTEFSIILPQVCC